MEELLLPILWAVFIGALIIIERTIGAEAVLCIAFVVFIILFWLVKEKHNDRNNRTGI